jgi:hypothetical protein
MSLKLIRQQLKQDLIGKDAFRGITLSYAWLANQFGHFSLGFIPAVILYAFKENKDRNDKGVYWPSLIIWGVWFAFEVFNYISSVLKQRNDTIILKRAKDLLYKPRRWQFISDTITDLIYFALGAFSASFIFKPTLVAALICIIFVVYLIYESYRWYLSKIYLQRALFPFQYRISQWTTAITDENNTAINTFIDDPFSGTHLLILGEDDEEKINLCVGIGSELSYLKKKCRYLTAMKAFERFYRDKLSEDSESHKFLWHWHEADVLIIDDINPSHAKIKDVITPDDFFEKINDNNGDRNKNLLNRKKVIWMLGDETTDDAVKTAWQEMLIKIGVNKNSIITINLSKKESTQS